MNDGFNEKFIESLYDYAYEELNKMYKEQSKDEEELLKKIAWIMLTYTVVDNCMNLNKTEKAAVYKKLSSFVIKMFENHSNVTEANVKRILLDITEKSMKANKIWKNKDDALKIVNERFKGLHFSSRVWENENLVSKKLHEEIKKFLNGDINVNEIKSHIKKTFGVEKYKIDRLVETEISRIQDEITHRFIREYDVEEVEYNATLDNTCSDCMEKHGKIFKVGEEPKLPGHPKCKCFLVPVLKNKVN